MSKQKSLFKTKVVPGKPGSGNLFDEEIVFNDGPVKCLGLEFENDDARRAHFTEELRKKLQDPEFRKIEGFPIGEDEDILKLSDPPYYTACPNPWIADFIEEWDAKKPKKPEGYQYQRKPFAADVSEGKNDPIYNAHSYHTKVPHKAIMRYILHYTEPGDIVFDGFCGTGMTGVAAQMCGDREVIESLGVTKQSPEQKYKVDKNGIIFERQLTEDGKYTWVEFSKLGARKAVLNDLSPAATFIAYNYNTPISSHEFEKTATKLIKEVKKRLGHLYQTRDKDGNTGKINYTVWSDLFHCPDCQAEINFFKQTVDIETNQAKNSFNCPQCSSLLNKRKLEQTFETVIDHETGEPIFIAKQVPVLINYSIGTKRHEKFPDKEDLEKISSCIDLIKSGIHPTVPLPDGYNLKQPKQSHGFTHTHNFYSRRTLVCLNAFYEGCVGPYSRQLNFLMGSVLPKLTKLNRYMRQHGSRALVGPMANALYVPPISVENNVIGQLEFQLKKVTKAFFSSKQSTLISTASSTMTLAPDNSVDYIFIDPPFGGNIMYSDMSFLRESWLKLRTNIEEEAIENNIQGKELHDYKELMQLCFSEAFRILRPGRWMTVEFSNTKASVWNVLQTSLQESGFVVASVAGLDKTRGGFHAMIGPTAVKQDLVISAYKPNGGFEERFDHEAQSEEGVWDFIRTHLKYLPVSKKQGYDLVSIPERDPRILYDQVIAYYVRKGYNVPIDSQEFQLGLSQRFSERDGMYFLPEQVAEYDRKKMMGGGRPLQQSLFISDEASAIEWLRSLLRDKPQGTQDIRTPFMKERGGWNKNEVSLELSTLLEQNFLPYDGKGPVPDQIHSYLSTNWKDMRNLPKEDPTLVAKAKGRWYVPDPKKAGDLEKLREKALLKEFEEYKQAKKKLKIFRLEAVRAGFKKLWQQRTDDAYKTIIVVAEKIPNKILEEDPKLLMWYDQAVTRSGGE